MGARKGRRKVKKSLRRKCVNPLLLSCSSPLFLLSSFPSVLLSTYSCCVCVHVCAYKKVLCVYAYVCSSVSAHMCMCMSRPGPVILLHLAFKAGSITGLELFKWPRLAGQWAQRSASLHEPGDRIPSTHQHFLLFTFLLWVLGSSACMTNTLPTGQSP